MKIDTKPLAQYKKSAVEKAKKAVKKNAFAILATAANPANGMPVDTGNLMGSMHTDPVGDGQNWTIEDGTDYGVFQELGTSRGVPARHFLGRACEKQADKFFNDVKDALK